MKYVLSFFFMALLLLNAKLLLAQQPAIAGLRFDYKKYYLDQRKKKYTGTDTIEVVYRFTNSGTQPLLIESVSSSCSCSVPDYTKAPVKPNETGYIKLTTTYDKLSLIKKVHAVVIANTKEKYYKLELFLSGKDNVNP
jgi:hypothetical protein